MPMVLNYIIITLLIAYNHPTYVVCKVWDSQIEWESDYFIEQVVSLLSGHVPAKLQNTLN